MDLLDRYPNSLEQLEILKKDYLGLDNSVALCYNLHIGQHDTEEHEMSNRTQKAATLVAMMDLVQRLQSKTRLLEALDSDVNAEDCCDLHDQVASLTHSLARFEDAMLRANRVNGVDAEYDNLFGEAV